MRAHRLNLQQRGFSIVELMVAMLISLFLLGGASAVLMNSSNTYKSTDSQSRLQENLRIATLMITRDLRMVGFFGCFSSKTSDPVNNPATNNLLNFPVAGHLLDTTAPFEGAEAANTWQPSNFADPQVVMLPNTDGITIRFLAGGPGTPLTASQTNSTDNLTVNGAQTNLVQGAIVGVYNCSNSHIFQITTDPTTGSIGHDGSGTWGNNDTRFVDQTPSGPQAVTYSATADSATTVTPAVFVRYFIGAGTRGPALFRQVFDVRTDNTLAQELVEGIDQMQILWAVDTDNDGLPDRFDDADTVADWRNVVGVRYALLGRSLEQSTDYAVDNVTTYDLLGQTIGPMNDRSLRRVVTNNVVFRNYQSCLVQPCIWD